MKNHTLATLVHVNRLGKYIYPNADAFTEIECQQNAQSADSRW